ncbi:polysaccharide biosynthesis protein [Bifidobacterium catenulatum]|uniref:Polysaccharide biosynthesis protein n=1 Tax=Bifidobacterium catenulatum TaxID=1686 RepID=A0A1V8PM49_9BIFI|nr:polysaccharide biosynthesis protein [Bifidobacterium catenulatum]
MDIYHITHRTAEECRATAELAKHASWSQAINTFRAKLDIQVMSRKNNLETPPITSRLMRKHKTVLNYLESRYADFYRRYDYAQPLPDDDPAYQGKVWLCWWQGIDNAPALVQRCVESIQRNVKEHDVIILTDENYRRYVDIPDWIVDKYRNGVFSRTHFSDILRYCLLSQHGGLWLDATFFCAHPLDDYLDMPLFTIKRPGYDHRSVACGMFAGYSLGCDYEHRRIFAVMRDFLFEYWRTNDFLIDYLLVDYMCKLAQQYDSRIAQAFESVVPNNPQCDDLVKSLASPFNQRLWDELKSDTSLFKLTWKQQFPSVVEGKDTFYARLLQQKL